MEQDTNTPNLLHRLKSVSKTNRIFVIVLVVAILSGLGTGYVLAKSDQAGKYPAGTITTENAKSPDQDKRTFRDFAEGKVTKKPEAKNGAYSEGTHLLVRDSGVPVALTSSVVDLTQYENKRVKVYGETQKAVKEGWLMDVGRVEEVK